MLDAIAMFESPAQWAIVLLVVMLLFGGAKIPEMMRGFGSGLREFKQALNDDTEDEAARQKEQNREP